MEYYSEMANKIIVFLWLAFRNSISRDNVNHRGSVVQGTVFFAVEKSQWIISSVIVWLLVIFAFYFDIVLLEWRDFVIG